MKKFLSVVLILTLILGSFSFAFAAVPRDVEGLDCAEAVDMLTAYGVISGYPDGTYRPENIVTRAELAKLIVVALGDEGKAADAKCTFPDAASHWATGFIAVAADAGIIDGYPDGTFGPQKTVTYNEAITMIVRALGYTELEGTWPGNFVDKAGELDILGAIEGSAAGANRGDIALLLYQAIDVAIAGDAADTLKVRLEALGAATVLKNGIIYTLEGNDWDKNAVQAMAIAADGTIAAVGTDEEIAAYVGSRTEVVDLAGKTVLPGLIDSHNHPIGTALTELFEINLYYDFDKEGSLATITEFVAANPDAEIYWGNGFNMGMVDENGNPPNKTWLDEICPDVPMILTSNDGHNQWLNTAALELCGITKDSVAPTGGNIQWDANGDPAGIISDAASLITVAQDFTREQLEEGTAWYLDVMAEWGYTSISSAGEMAGVWDILNELLAAGELNLRMNYSYMMDPEDPQAGFDILDGWKAEVDSDILNVTTAKFFADGVVEGITGYLLEPYAEGAGMAADYVSEPIWEMDVMKETMKKSLEKGYQIHVHSIGDAATRMTLDCIEYAQKENGEGDYRNVITHLQVVDEADKPRFGELGIVAALQPFWHMQEPDWYEYVDKLFLGEERAWKEYPVKSLKDNGAILTSSGDYPVSPTNNPFWAIESGVTRNLNNAEYYGVDDIKNIDDPTWLLNPDERVTVKDMVEAYTKNGAYQMFREDDLGSLKAGKWADYIIIDKDIMKIPALDIDGIMVLTTVMNGKVVYGTY